MKQNGPSYLSAAPKSDRSGVPRGVTLTIGGEAVQGVNPPLVSFILVNWNYAAYVGQTIDSIIAQDYPHFECIVVDNGSTDGSQDIIARHIKGDGRFRLIGLGENKGQLGGALIALKEIKGSFVVFVDSDDLLFPNFASSHLQVHLSVVQDVAITSNHVIEIDESGHVLGSHSGNLPIEWNEGASDFRHADSTPRLSTIDDGARARLGEVTRIMSEAGQMSWIWGPGTANMLRSSVVNLFTSGRDGAILMRATDNYAFPLCHTIAGSAIIGLPLSAYRIHGKNYCTPKQAFQKFEQRQHGFLTKFERGNASQSRWLSHRARADRAIVRRKILEGPGWRPIDDPPERHAGFLPLARSRQDIRTSRRPYKIKGRRQVVCPQYPCARGLSPDGAAHAPCLWRQGAWQGLGPSAAVCLSAMAQARIFQVLTHASVGQAPPAYRTHRTIATRKDHRMFYVAGLLAALSALFYASGNNEIGKLGTLMCRYGDTFCDHPVYLLIAAGIAAAWGAFVSMR